MNLTKFNEVITMSSKEIAKLTGKRHDHVMIDIEKLIAFYSTTYSPEKTGDLVKSGTYKDTQNREYRCFHLSKGAALDLVTGYSLPHRHAVNQRWMELEAKQAKSQDSLEWKQARLSGKQVRRSVTDTIKEFVEYATEQGSRSAHMYYMAITKMEYKALGLLRESDDNFRDTMTITQLSFLSTAENLAKIAIQQGMDHELHYKQIYELAKNRVMAFAKSVEWAKLNDVNADQRKLK